MVRVDRPKFVLGCSIRQQAIFEWAVLKGKKKGFISPSDKLPRHVLVASRNLQKGRIERSSTMFSDLISQVLS